MAVPTQGEISDQELEDAIARKRELLHREIGARIRGLIDRYLPASAQAHALSDPRRIPPGERAAFLKDLEGL